MPQMAPMNWLILFILFSTIFVIFFIMNYFNIVFNKPQTMKKETSKTFINWKW